jgi:hypothetical protein
MKDWLGKCGVVLWLFVLLPVLAVLMGGHIVSLPAPNDYQRLKKAVQALHNDHRSPLLIHVIYHHCSCTNSLVAHLIDRGPFEGVRERVVFVGNDPTKSIAARQAGYDVVTISRQALVHTFGIEAAPLLLIVDGTGQIVYLGGYYRHPATVAPQDKMIYAHIQRGQAVDPLPVYGCAVSDRLQQAFDPIGVKYGKE